MSTIIYEEFPIRTVGVEFNFEDADATKFYMEHYKNRLLLQFIANNTLATFDEKAQARKELVICDRKLEYWRKHPNFSQQVANDHCSKALRDWSQK